MRRERFDPASLIAGLAVLALGTLLELDQLEVLHLGFEFAMPALLATVGAVLLSTGLSRRR